MTYFKNGEIWWLYNDNRTIKDNSYQLAYKVKQKNPAIRLVAVHYFIQ